MTKKEHSVHHPPKRRLDAKDNTLTRIQTLVEESAPNPNRPKLSKGIEKRLAIAKVEAKAAAIKAILANVLFEIDRFVEDVRSGKIDGNEPTEPTPPNGATDPNKVNEPR